MASAIGARAYKECSALRIEGVDEVFEIATRASMLMRDGVHSSHQPSPSYQSSYAHRRRGSGSGNDESKSWACCVIC